MEVGGDTILISGSAIATLGGLAGAYIKAKFGKTEIPQPMETTKVGPFVTCGECKQHREAISKRIDTIETSTRKILDKLDDIDTRAEQRSVDLHRRLDPIIEKVAANSAKVELIENTVREAAKAATIGGRK